jgi:hypothetical protein
MSCAGRRRRGRTSGERRPFARQHWWFLVTIGEAWFNLKTSSAPKRDHVCGGTAQRARLGARVDRPPARHAVCLARLSRRRDGQPYDYSSETVLRRFRRQRGRAHVGCTGRIGLALLAAASASQHPGSRSWPSSTCYATSVSSCVSGGAIVAAYHLAVELLQKRRMRNHSRRLCGSRARSRTSSCAGRSNIRTRIAAEWTTNPKMLRRAIRARSSGRACRRSCMLVSHPIWTTKTGADLTVTPKARGILLKDHTWRAAKVPTSAERAAHTGNLVFIATWMEEPPANST